MTAPKAPYEIMRSIKANDRILGYRSHQAIAFIRSEIEATGISPSYAMIRDELGLCSNGKVHEVVVRLERRGLIYRDGTGRQRRIRLVVDNEPQ